MPCVCPGGGAGGQVCAASGESYGTCVCGVDGGAVDAARTDASARADVVGTDAARDAGLRPADPRCADQITRRDWCGPEDGGACVDRRGDPNNCGGCGARCTAPMTDCFDGVCFVPLDAGAAVDATR